MPVKVKVQVCGKCGRGRKGHALPFGAKNCKLSILSSEEKAEELKRLTEEITKSGDIAEIIEEENIEGEKDSGEPSDKSKSAMDKVDERKKLLLEKKAQLEKQKRDSEEVIKKQREELQARKELDDLEALIEQLTADVEGNQAIMINLQTEIDNPSVPKAAPATVPVSQQSVSQDVQPNQPVQTFAQPVGQQPVVGQPSVVPGVQPGKPGQPAADSLLMPPPRTPVSVPLNSAQPSILDPSMHVYAQAAAADMGTGARPKALGHTAEQLLRDNPQLAAACGLKRQDQQAKPYTDGKSTAEQFTFKQQLKDTDKYMPSYYDFMQGALKMMYLRVTKDHLPVDEHLKYYETLAGFACQYKWWAVFKLHCQLSYEVELGTRRWGSYIDYKEAMRYLCQESQVPPKQEKRGAFRERSGSLRDVRGSDEFGGDFRDRRSVERSRSESSLSGRPKLCNQFNDEVFGCNFGGACQFRHECKACAQRGVTAKHPALYCSQSVSGQSTAGGGAAR